MVRLGADGAIRRAFEQELRPHFGNAVKDATAVIVDVLNDTANIVSAE